MVRPLHQLGREDGRLRIARRIGAAGRVAHALDQLRSSANTNALKAALVEVINQHNADLLESAQISTRFAACMYIYDMGYMTEEELIALITLLT